jgi:glucose-1-phosphate cytidylyltransferase
MKTLILCGGKGTRAYPHTLELPKPLLEVAGRPVLLHVMEIYAMQGYSEFILAAGYKQELIEEFAAKTDPSWQVSVVDTGETTNTGGRVHACRDHVGDTFFVTYADGLGNVDLQALERFHRAHAGSATMTTVPLPSQYGTIEVSPEGRVERFREKPRLPEHHINAGFFVLDSSVYHAWPGEDLERDVLPALGQRGELFAYRHDGFWKSMDTYKDSLELSSLYDEGTTPWMSFGTAASS